MSTADLRWNEDAPGVWVAQIGARAPLTLLGLAGAPPRVEALGRMATAGFPLPPGEIACEQTAGGVVLRFPLAERERLYGLGLQFQSVNQRGAVRHLHVDHYGAVDNGRTHAPCPFYVSSAGYGVLIDSARAVSVYAGSASRADSPRPPQPRDRTTDPNWTPNPLSDAVEVFVPGDSARVVLFAGPTPLDAVRRYNLYCGGGCLPPRWGLGFWHRVPMAFSSKDVLREVAQFAEHDFPLDVVGLEPGWQSRAYPCTHAWDPGRFPDPGGFCRGLLEKGIRVNLWENPYLSEGAEAYPAMKPLSGSHTVWCGLVPDYTLPEARQITQGQHGREHLDRGVSGYKIDEVDGVDAWLWPGHATFPSGRTGEEMRQTYGLQVQQTLTALFREHDRRTYGLVRGTNSGGVSYPYVIYSDCYDHRQFITGLCNSGFLGVLWTPEVRGARSAEEWVRRIQSVCFSPLAMINAWADGTKPWSFPEVEDAVRDALRLRRRLLPYLYSAFARYHFDGTPPFRAMALESGGTPDAAPGAGVLDSTENPYAVSAWDDCGDQYLMGGTILVAPMFAGEASRKVNLPPGAWCDFYTGDLVEGGRSITVTPGLEQIPLFVRDGGIVPLLDEADPSALEVRHYGRSEGRFLLYDDDGETYAYERGEYWWTELRVEQAATGLSCAADVLRQGGWPTYSRLTWRFMSPPSRPQGTAPVPGRPGRH